MKKIMLFALLAAALIAPTAANDSSAAIGVGGLELTRNGAISMDSEELFLSVKQVRVKYRFTNHSKRDVETLVSFPLPAVPSGIAGHLGDRGYPDWTTDLNFETRIDGTKAELNVRQITSVIGDVSQRDVSVRLGELGWPVQYWKEYAFYRENLAKLNEDDKKRLLAEGLLRPGAVTGSVHPNWQLSTHVTRKQIFPAGKTVEVEHRYEPYTGSSIGGGLLKKYRKEYARSFAQYARAYCIDGGFLRSFDRKLREQDRAAQKTGASSVFVEQWLSYVLSSGANWRGPIGDFRLVVEVEKPSTLVSFCMDGIKQISPTQYEVRKTNFEPKGDIEVLIVPLFSYGPE